MFTMVVQGSHVMQFARAVGDLTPAFYDADRWDATGTQTLTAPPTFLMAADHFDPDYARRPRPGTPWISSGAAHPDQPTGFHTEQHFTFHRPIRTGDRLAVSHRPGNTWHRTGPRAGKMTFREILWQYHDPTGELVAEARWVETAVEHRPASSPSESAGVSPGSTDETSQHSLGIPSQIAADQSWRLLLTQAITPTDIAMYAGASGDFHPMHCDDVYARKRGYPGVFAHGMLTMGMSGRVITDAVGHDRVTTFGGRITSQVWPGDRLMGYGHVTDVTSGPHGQRATVTIRTENQHGQAVFTGSATVRLD